MSLIITPVFLSWQSRFAGVMIKEQFFYSGGGARRWI
jgi:hypothetical protein